TRFSRDWSSDVCSSDLTSAERFAPGDMLVFTLARDAGSPAAADGALTVRLGWFTDGKGLRDAAIVWSEELHGLGPGDERAFEVRSEERRVGKEGATRRE